MEIKIRINDHDYIGYEGETILHVARRLNIHIPTLCYMFHDEDKTEHHPASCRVCVVEIKGRRNLAPACATPIVSGMEIYTHSPRVRNARRVIVELLLSDHPADCLICAKNGKCELQQIASELGIRQVSYDTDLSKVNKWFYSKSLKRNPGKCILCGHCVDMCENIQTVGSLGNIGRGFGTLVGYPFNECADDSNCVFCGQCIKVCPTGALTQVNQTEELEKILLDDSKFVVCQTAPATRVSLGEEFGLPIGTDVTKKMVMGLRELGFKRVFDTNFSADLTIMEETTEFIERIKNKEKLPIITSCCPAWVKFLEGQYDELIPHLSTCKSPQQMMGAVIKSYYADKYNIDPKSIYVVSVMPCIAKKFECDREELNCNGLRDVDMVISVMELATLLKRHGIDIRYLEDSEFDEPLGESTGGADIFASTGGVMESVLRTASKMLYNQDLQIDFKELRGEVGIRETSVNIGGVELKVAVASGLGNARKLMKLVKDGNCPYQAVEIMACPSGCVNGGGQPTHLGISRKEIIRKRQKSIYNIDKNKTKRVSSENKDITKLYNEYFSRPNSYKAHELLHTTYYSRRPK
ncbi:MAG: NADH-dependent [FeFe] hydrogenase, group A6 [Bacilli bacterium]|nr:NADH-dependent [FeFe] hydrogenase, group A6 [Bacilli bacterium]